jgi:hypothetical protein
MQPLRGTTVWRVRYQGNEGTETYRLRGGTTYVFQKDGEGFWQLYRQPAVVDPDPPVLPQ